MGAGFKADLKVSFDDFKLTIPVRYEKLTSKDICDQIQVISKAKDNGEEVEKCFRYLDKNTKADVSEKVESIAERKKVIKGIDTGALYNEGQVQDFQISKDDKGEDVLVEVVAPSETTKELEFLDTRDMEKYNNYLYESEYEIWSENEKDMKELAEYLIKHNICLLADFQRVNTFKPFKAVLKPHFENGYLTFRMGLTMTQYIYHHLMEGMENKGKKKQGKGLKVSLNV